MTARSFHAIFRAWAIAMMGMAALVAVAPSASARSARTLRYVVLANGQPAGMEVDAYDKYGALDSDYEFNDRGRGPKIHAHYEYSSDNLPLRIAVTGVNYLKAPVEERFVVGAAGLQWSSAGEHGVSKQRGFYLSNDGVGGPELAALVRALLGRGDRALALLPAGRAVLESGAEALLEDHGETLHVRQYLINGLDLTPTPVWIDDEGNFFAFPGRLSATISAGW
jgi:hypothetical protein